MNESILSKQKPNYNQNLEDYDHFIALDWSQVNIALARSTRKNPEPRVIEWAESNPKLVKDHLRNLKGNILLTIEETTTSHWLYVEFKDYVKRIIICDPYTNHLLSAGPKTDKIDAVKLCKLLRSGLLKEVFHTSDKLYELRQLLSAYEDLVKAGVRLQNQRSAIYRARGLHYTRRESKELKEQLNQSDTLEFITNWQDRTIDQYNVDKIQFEEQIAKMIKGNKKIRSLTKLPGIGTIYAFTIFANVIEPKRFKKKGHYLSYCGLVLHEKTSGNKSYGKRIPRCNRQLKTVYKTAARIAIRGANNPAYDYYQSLSAKGLTHKQASLMVARYLAKVSLGIMKSGHRYDPYRWRKDEVAA